MNKMSGLFLMGRGWREGKEEGGERRGRSAETGDLFGAAGG